MDARMIKMFPAGSIEWLDQRRNKIGGSEIGAIMGLSPWKSHYALWHEKKGAAPKTMNPVRAAIGHGLEQTAANLFEQDYPEYRTMRGGCWQSKTRPWQIAEPDRFITPTDSRKKIGIIEIKTVEPSMIWVWGDPEDGSDAIPPTYFAQIQWYLSTLGLDLCYLVAIMGYNTVKYYEIRRDEQFIAQALNAGRAFIDSLTSGVEPDIDTTDSTYEMIRQLHPDIHEGENVEIDSGLAKDWVDALEASKQADRRLVGVKNRLADFMGCAQAATFNGAKVAKRQARGDAAPFVTTNPKGVSEARILLEARA
ncbi:YqaJ viral recombinase family protein [uncultured Mobiluncus sp.]|uniref:YqaJ viral recombinase family nuclease n=1 Tax=uncultured Mobiluncus sp. TaxID=293425 RepID=UPI00262B67BE|nr:YqaJ viral recombinase family protein [uncultured Mobiluncus sp.]